jgi:predicted DNA-binding transcriptional regulator YafY
MGDFMTVNFDFKGNKGFRLIYIFEKLSNGELIKKRELARDLAVSEKSIQRDIQALRMYLAETRFHEEEININYDKTRKGYYLKNSF